MNVHVGVFTSVAYIGPKTDIAEGTSRRSNIPAILNEMAPTNSQNANRNRRPLPSRDRREESTGGREESRGDREESAVLDMCRRNVPQRTVDERAKTNPSMLTEE